MGLDSVELIIAFEKYFKITIPDREAEKMYRISDVVHYLESIFNKNYTSERVSLLLQNKFVDLLNLSPGDAIFERYRIEDKMFWHRAAITTNLKIILPKKTPGTPNLLQRLFYQKPGYTITQITCERFLEVTAYVYYKELLEPDRWNTEVLTIAVCGITIELNGPDPYEMYPSSSFVDDLGIN